MQELRNRDIERVLLTLPLKARLFLEEHKAYLAGGFIRDTLANRPPKDVDIFGPAHELEDFRVGADWDEVVTTRARTCIPPYGLPIQLVTGFPAYSPQDLLSRFNFTVNQAVIWYEDEVWCGLCADDFYSDLAAERLVLAGFEPRAAAAHTLMKTAGFIKDGWSIELEELMKVAAAATFGMQHTTIGEAVQELVQHARCEYPCMTRENSVPVAHSNSWEKGSFETSLELDLTESIF